MTRMATDMLSRRAWKLHQHRFFKHASSIPGSYRSIRTSNDRIQAVRMAQRPSYGEASASLLSLCARGLCRTIANSCLSLPGVVTPSNEHAFRKYGVT